MSVNYAIECFAFALFRKLWIRNGLPDCTDIVPDYPVVLELDCPDDFCDMVFAFQCFSSSFFEELCEEDYNAFAHSRSDFFYYLFPNVVHFREYRISFFHATIGLAVLTAEMGIACARRDNDIFIFTCPLAFAMVFEEIFDDVSHSVGYQIAWGRILTLKPFQPFRDLAGIVGRSASSRRDLIYRLQLLRFELHGKCPDGLNFYLENAIKMGALMDNSQLPTERLSMKYSAALNFPFYFQPVYQENFVVYLEPLYAENFIMRHHFLRKCIFQDIASVSGITDEESLKDFFALYEESVFGKRAVIPPQPEIISDSSSAQELYDLDSNCMVTREIHEDDQDPDNRDAAFRPEECSGIISDTPSLPKFYDFKPKDPKFRDPQDNCGLDGENTGHRPQEPSGIISEVPSLDELNNLKPKDSKSRDPRDVYGLEERDIKHTQEYSSYGFEDVQSNSLMESPSTVEEKMKKSYGSKSSRSLDIFYKLRNMTDSHVSVDAFENSKFPKYSSTSALKDQEVAIDTSVLELKKQEATIETSASELEDQIVATDTKDSELKDQEVAIVTSAPEPKAQEVTADTRDSKLRDQGIPINTIFELEDSQISDDVNRDNPDVKNQGISLSSKLDDQERVSDTGPFELREQIISMDIDVSITKDQEISLDSNGFDTRNQIILEGTGASNFDDEMVFSPDRLISQNDGEGTNFEFQVLELSCSKNISSPSEVCLESKRAVEIDNLENSNITASETRDQKIFAEESYSKCKDEGILSTVDDPVFHDDSGEARIDFPNLNKNSSLSTSMIIDSNDEETLVHDCQTSVFDIFSEQYLKLGKDETPFEDSNTPKPSDSEVFDENFIKTEEVLKEHVSSDLPFIKDVYSTKPPVEAFSKIETSPETSFNSADRNGGKVFQSESKSMSESPRKAANPSLELPTTKASLMQEMVEGMEQQYESLMEKVNDCCKLIDGMPGAMKEVDKSSKGGKKRKNNRLKKKNKQGIGKETEEPNIVENGPEKSEFIELNVYQLFLVMGAPFEKPIKREGRFMDRITIDSF